ncbi:RING-type domain-containing protein [Caenorhabditis elegans]|uniref:RING-type domain-containing protein n=1 Tax=Caenorhabditis elegans TaxID=6239 RepID=G5EGI6_CAEEL|nr:RBR-type E3 ubiquitin transferase [Caenorhabditis elegans]CAA98263.5 RBR-type E3 ubiquitin transferase [Caenorhabditis elegans]|eukprot:NP_872234.4 RBR-type E3 ubiquitin transferase [Caenorhabditis elegans]
MSDKVSENNDIKGFQLTNRENEQPMDLNLKEKKPTFTIVGCELCQIKDEIRIILRQCGHVVCLPCVLEYIKNKIIVDGHPRFKCPLSTCNAVVHENDINAVLDEKEPALERYMSIVHRRYLQYKQNKHSIMAALPSSDIKRCPLCRSIYMHVVGCNYVICANSACNTAFCWLCEKPMGRPSSHFTTASKCRLGYTDYERIFRSIQLILDVNFVILWILLPFVYLIAFLYIPVLIIFLIPASLAYDAYRKEKDSHDFLVPIDVLTIIFRVLIGILIGIIVCVPFAIGSIVSGSVLMFLYMGFLAIRTIPCGLSGDRVGTFLCLMRWAGNLFKIGPYGKLLEEARKERNDALVKLEENRDDFKNALSTSKVLVGTTTTSSTTQATTIGGSTSTAGTTVEATTTTQA